MRPVDQDRFYSKELGTRGNCLQAAVASILDLPLAAVPNFMDADSAHGFWAAYEEFLRARGFEYIELPGNHCPDCFYLASGSSPRGVKHAVIMRDGKLVHDPHPSRAGIDPIDHIHVLAPIDPARAQA